MAFELTGKLIDKGKTVKHSDTFRKREFVVEKKEMAGGKEYFDYVKFQLTQDRCGLIDPFHINDEIRVYFNVRGNRWEKDGKVNYFTNLDAWKVEAFSNGQVLPPAAPDHTEDDMPPDTGNDLPF